MNSGIYTFYNEQTKSYLAYQGKSLILSKTPQNWLVESYGSSGFYVYAGETDLLLDIDNAIIKEGTTIKIWYLTGYDVQIWNIVKNENATYSFLYSGDNHHCLGFDSGKAVLQIRNKYNRAQEWKAVRMSEDIFKPYRSVSSTCGIIELRLPLDITRVISEPRLNKWANDLETAYYSFYELTNYMPHKSIIVEAYKSCEYTGYVIGDTNVIHIDRNFIYEDLRKMSACKDDWSFCALHEMGHMFDNGRPWAFEGEAMTDFKLAYVLEKNGAAARLSNGDDRYIYYGKDIMKAYDALSSDFSHTYDIFGCVHRLLKIKEDIGWEPFKRTFHRFQEDCDKYAEASKQEMFENFRKFIFYYSGKDIKTYFTSNEWNAIIKKLNGQIKEDGTDMVKDTHVLLDSKNWGACKSFTGKVLLTVILVDDDESTWTTEDMEGFRKSQMAATADILKNAKQYQVPLKINVQYMRCRVKGTFDMNEFLDWVDDALKACGFAEQKQVIPTLKQRYGVKEAPVMFAVNRKGRSFSVIATTEECFEYSILYRDHGDYRHELLHLFGAKDYYFPNAVREVAKKYFPDSVMLNGSNGVVDNLTAYMVGWVDTPSSDAAAFLEETAWMTEEYMEEVMEAELQTGYGTIQYGDGIYTGELFEGLPHGKGHIVWDNGNTYDGEWRHGSAHGKGTVNWNSNNTAYEGEWQDWKRHGYGTYTYADGRKVSGRWENDEYKGEW